MRTASPDFTLQENLDILHSWLDFLQKEAESVNVQTYLQSELQLLERYVLNESNIDLIRAGILVIIRQTEKLATLLEKDNLGDTFLTERPMNNRILKTCDVILLYC